MTRDLSPDERAFVASSVRTAIDLAFSHWDGVPALDLDRSFRHLLRETLTRGDRRRFSLEMAAFMAGLQNGHTRYRDPVGWASFSGPLGFQATPIDSTWVITRAWRPGLQPGQVIERVDGHPPEDVYQALKRFISASSERGRRRRLFDHPHLFPKRLRLRVSGRSMLLHRVPGSMEPPVERATGRWLRHGEVAYLRLPSFRDSAHEERALRLIAGYRRARTLVIDVRGNSGGVTPSRLIGALMDRPWRGMAEATPERIGTVHAYAQLLEMAEAGAASAPRVPVEELASLERFRAWDRFQLLIPAVVHPARTGAYTGRVILLTDGGCVSACEDFLIPFKNSGRGTLVGTTTDGSTGQPYILNLLDGIQAYIGSKRVYFPDCGPFEGKGIAPDHEVAMTQQDLRNGRDPVLEYAKELADRDR